MFLPYNTPPNGTPLWKLPDCPQCGEDELSMLRPGYAKCNVCSFQIKETRSVVKYLETKIVEARRTKRPIYGMMADGYTSQRGAPTDLMIRLDGETRWRRLMVWQFSNVPTFFVRIQDRPHVVSAYDLPASLWREE